MTSEQMDIDIEIFGIDRIKERLAEDQAVLYFMESRCTPSDLGEQFYEDKTSVLRQNILYWQELLRHYERG